MLIRTVFLTATNTAISTPSGSGQDRVNCFLANLNTQHFFSQRLLTKCRVPSATIPKKKWSEQKKITTEAFPTQGLFFQRTSIGINCVLVVFLLFQDSFLENQLHDPTSFPATHTTRWPPWWYGANCCVKAVADFWLQPCETEMFSQVTHFLFVKRISPIWKDHHCKTTFVMNEFQFTNVTPLFILMLRSCCQGKNGAPETASLGIP